MVHELWTGQRKRREGQQITPWIVMKIDYFKKHILLPYLASILKRKKKRNLTLASVFHHLNYTWLSIWLSHILKPLFYWFSIHLILNTTMLPNPACCYVLNCYPVILGNRYICGKSKILIDKYKKKKYMMCLYIGILNPVTFQNNHRLAFVS